jgi:hypothetical protein
MTSRKKVHESIPGEEKKLVNKMTIKEEHQLEQGWQKHLSSAREEDLDLGLMMMALKKTHYHLTSKLNIPAKGQD